MSIDVWCGGLISFKFKQCMKMDQMLIMKNILISENGVSRIISADVDEDNILFKGVETVL